MTHRLYVGHCSAGERELRDFFREYGRITNIMQKTGFCFVDFDDIRDADDAVYDLNGTFLNGERITVEHAKGVDHVNERRGGFSGYRGTGGTAGGRGESRGRGGPRGRGGEGASVGGGFLKFGPASKTQWEVRVENLSSRLSWQDLKDYLRNFGDITYCEAHIQEKNTANCCFGSEIDMMTVIKKVHDTDLEGRNNMRKIRMISLVKGISRSPTRSASPPGKKSKSKSSSRSRSPSRKSSSKSKSKSKSSSRSPTPKRKRSNSSSSGSS